MQQIYLHTSTGMTNTSRQMRIAIRLYHTHLHRRQIWLHRIKLPANNIKHTTIHARFYNTHLNSWVDTV